MSKGKSNKNLIGIILVFLSLLPSASFAGIPEPGILLYGHVRNSTGKLLTSGTLNWTFTPVAGGKIVTVTTALQKIEGPGGPYSYAVMIPMEKRITGYPVSANTIPLSSSPVTYTSTAQVVGKAISFSDTLDVSTIARGIVRCVSFGNADADGDGMPDVWEQAIINADANDDITSVCDVLPTDDFDKDGHTNYEEYESGTDPVAVNGPPTVLTDKAVGITHAAATLLGTINPNGYSTDVWFEYGTTTGYGTTTSSQSIGSGTSPVSVNASIGGLSPSTTYYFRAVGRNSAGTEFGSPQSFTSVFPETTEAATVSVQLSCPASATVGQPLTVTVNLYNWDCNESVSVNRFMARIMGNADGTLSGLGILGPYSKKLDTPKVVPSATCNTVTTPGTVAPFELTLTNAVPVSLTRKIATVDIEAITGNGQTFGGGECVVKVLP